LICYLAHHYLIWRPESELCRRISINFKILKGSFNKDFLILFLLRRTANTILYAILWIHDTLSSTRVIQLMCIIIRYNFYSERINILCCELIRQRNIYLIILFFCLFTCFNLINKIACIKFYKSGKRNFSLFICLQNDFLIFIVYLNWKSVDSWLSLEKRNISQLFHEEWLSINDFNFKWEFSPLIQWIWDMTENFKLAKMNYGLKLIDILLKYTEWRQFCVYNSHRKQLKIIICWHSVIWKLIHNDSLKIRGTKLENWRIIYY
jgi:hypothetical protein